MEWEASMGWRKAGAVRATEGSAERRRGFCARGRRAPRVNKAAAHPKPHLLAPAPQIDLGKPRLAVAKPSHSLDHVGQKTLQQPLWEQNNLILADGASLANRV